MNVNIKIFSTPEKVAEALARDLFIQAKRITLNKKTFTIALSGGDTPKFFFSEIANNYLNFNWEYIHFYWVDERCVSPDSPESNFGSAKQYFLDKINIPQKNIHRIKGEDNPGKEAERYSDEIKKNVPSKEGLPSFDCILLGIGEDGHTASIFPNQLQLFDSDKICEVAVHPLTNQKRITLTGNIINYAVSIIFLVTGRQKANIVSGILNDNNKIYPAAHINPRFGKLDWHMDKEAANLLNYNNL